MERCSEGSSWWSSEDNASQLGRSEERRMEEVRGSPARRLSQILDPIARLATDFGSSSAPCSPRLGARGHEASSPQAAEAARRQPEPGRGGLPPTGGGADSPRLWPRQLRQAPAPPPRPRHNAANNNNNHAALPAATLAVHARDSPYVNVPNLVFQKQDKKGFADAARSAGYVELRDAKPKCSPYDFTSESSGHVEYADKVRTFAAQTDFVEASSSAASCYEANELAAFARARSNFDPGPGPRAGHLDRAYSFSGRQPEQQTAAARMFAENRLYAEQRGAAGGSEAAKKEKLESRAGYGASKSLDGYSSAVEELNWQERCLELQLELHRSRSQATRVRDMLREKVSSVYLSLLRRFFSEGSSSSSSESKFRDAREEGREGENAR